MIYGVDGVVVEPRRMNGEGAKAIAEVLKSELEDNSTVQDVRLTSAVERVRQLGMELTPPFAATDTTRYYGFQYADLDGHICIVPGVVLATVRAPVGPTNVPAEVVKVQAAEFFTHKLQKSPEAPTVTSVVEPAPYVSGASHVPSEKLPRPVPLSTTIGQLDRLISEMLIAASNPDFDEVDRKTLKHHADDMLGAANKILVELGNDPEGEPHPPRWWVIQRLREMQVPEVDSVADLIEFEQEDPTTMLIGLVKTLSSRLTDREDRSLIDQAIKDTQAALGNAPIPMLVTCPGCGKRHVDKDEFAVKPHHTHACQFCGMTWRPALGPTVGVQFLPGFKDEPSIDSPLDRAIEAMENLVRKQARLGQSITRVQSRMKQRLEEIVSGKRPKGPGGLPLTRDAMNHLGREAWFAYSLTLGGVNKHWDALSEEERNAWMVAGSYLFEKANELAQLPSRGVPVFREPNAKEIADLERWIGEPVKPTILLASQVGWTSMNTNVAMHVGKDALDALRASGLVEKPAPVIRRYMDDYAISNDLVTFIGVTETPDGVQTIKLHKARPDGFEGDTVSFVSDFVEPLEGFGKDTPPAPPCFRFSIPRDEMPIEVWNWAFNKWDRMVIEPKGPFKEAPAGEYVGSEAPQSGDADCG